MTRATLRVRLRPCERPLVRLLALVGQRGFEVAAVHAERGSDGTTELWLVVEADARAPELLVRQVRRLHDVELAELELPAGSEEEP